MILTLQEGMEMQNCRGLAKRLLGFTRTFFALSITLLNGAQCLAQVARVNADELMDAVFDLRKAATAADKVAADGRKYCHWGVVVLDSSDLDSAISRFLLMNGSRVADDILASKMWRVSFVATDLINQFEAGWQDCNRGAGLIRDVGDVAQSGKTVLSKLQDAKFRFDRLAFQQTTWQEWKYQRTSGEKDGILAPGLGARDVLGAARELRESWDIAEKAVHEAGVTKDCQRWDAGQPDEPVDLEKLIERLSGTSGSKVWAYEIWQPALMTDVQILRVEGALVSCNYYAIWKKKAKKVAEEVSDAEQRLKTAISKVQGLALKQTEWEEQVLQRQGTEQ